MRTILSAFSSMVLLGAVSPAWSQSSYPDKPIRAIVAWPAGGTTDTMGRIYLDKLKDLMGQPIIVENKPGATGSIGAEAAAKSPGDGYTLLVNSSTMVINPWVMKLQYDLQKDLTPIVRTADAAYVLTVNPKLPVKNFEEFISFAKKNPGKVLCGTYGVASPPHLAMELLNKEAGIDIGHVPYRTYLQSMTDLLSGQLTCSVDPPTVVISHVQAGKVRAIAHTGSGALPGATGNLFADIEPFGKRYPGAVVTGWQGVFVPSSTPAPIVARLRTEWRKVIADPEVAAKIRSYGFDPAGDDVQAFIKAIGDDYEKFGRVIRDRNIRLD